MSDTISIVVPDFEIWSKGSVHTVKFEGLFVRIFEHNQTKVAPHKALHGVPCSQETVHRRNPAFLRCEFLKHRKSVGGCVSAFLNNKELGGGHFPMGFS